MLDVNTITGDRQIWALTGLDMAAFCALAEPFTAGSQAPAAGPGQTLLFILFYLKVCPTFDVLGATFGLPRSKAREHAPRLAKALAHCLRTACALLAHAGRAAGAGHRLAGPNAGPLCRCAGAAARCH